MLNAGPDSSKLQLVGDTARVEGTGVATEPTALSLVPPSKSLIQIADPGVTALPNEDVAARVAELSLVLDRAA